MGARGKRREKGDEFGKQHQTSTFVRDVDACAVPRCLVASVSNGKQREKDDVRRDFLHLIVSKRRIFLLAFSFQQQQQQEKRCVQFITPAAAPPITPYHRAEVNERNFTIVIKIASVQSNAFFRSLDSLFQYAWLEKNHVTEVGSTYKTLGKQVDHKPSTWRCEDQAAAGK